MPLLNTRIVSPAARESLVGGYHGPPLEACLPMGRVETSSGSPACGRDICVWSGSFVGAESDLRSGSQSSICTPEVDEGVFNVG